jgi:hypothetical protein
MTSRGIILRTRCGCERITVCSLGNNDVYLVPLVQRMPPMQAVGPDEMPRDRSENREFRWNGRERNGMAIFEEV